jgi:predicted dehydrogenase
VKTYADYHDLMAHPGMDCVAIATPDHQHRPMLYAALDARKDVYLEKPFSLNLEESTQMVRAARATGRIVQVGVHRRSMPFL